MATPICRRTRRTRSLEWEQISFDSMANLASFRGAVARKFQHLLVLLTSDGGEAKLAARLIFVGKSPDSNAQRSSRPDTDKMMNRIDTNCIRSEPRSEKDFGAGIGLLIWEEKEK